MEWVFFWFILAIIVGVAANTRGRSGFGWFLLAVVISPLLAGLLILALPSLKAAHTVIRTETPQRIDKPFEPEGVLAGTPYRVGAGGTVEAMLQGALVRFENMDQFRAAAEGRDAVPAKPVASPTLRNEVNGIPYTIDAKGNVTAQTPIGMRTYANWASFRQAILTQRWS